MASQRGEVRVVVSAVPAASNDSLDEEVSVYDEADAPDETAALLPGKAKPAASGIVGTCSFPQTTFNVVNLIVGLGLLSIPYCLRQAGWAFGLPALALCVLVMNRTARMVCRCLADGGHAFVPTSFPDLADAAFGGTAARALISILFVTELYVADVAILIVAADNLSQLYPGVPALHAKLLVGAVMYASTFLNLAYLSYTSLFGMLGSLTLVSAVVFDGLTKSESPGSLLDPMPTELWTTPYRLTLVVGILISCLSGHAVYPGIYLAMRGRERVGRVLDLSFGIVAAVYATMAVTGYLMFGEDTSNEITKNLLPLEHNVLLNTIITWLMVFIPVTKFALLMEPVSYTISLSIWSSSSSATKPPSSPAATRIRRGPSHATLSAPPSPARTPLPTDDVVEAPLAQPVPPPGWLKPAVKTFLSLLALLISLLFPRFEAVLALMGSLLSSGVSIVFPAACYLRMFGGKAPWYDLGFAWLVLVFGLFVAVAGTAVSVIEAFS